MGDDAELAKIFGAVLDLCKLKAGETLAVLTQEGERHNYAVAYLAAAQERGAHAFQLNLPRRVQLPGGPSKRTALSGNTAAVEVLKKADLLIRSEEHTSELQSH